tara:strand:- start:58 stop:720 length:663 start_codon:yes stop_codon:yes gene_type:complete
MKKLFKFSKVILSQQFMLVGDLAVILDIKTQYLINTKPQYKLLSTELKKIKDTKVTSIYSEEALDATDGVGLEYNFCPQKIGSKKKPSLFLGIPTNTFNHFDINSLIKMSIRNGDCTGKINIKSGKICFFPLCESKNSPFPKEHLSKSKLKSKEMKNFLKKLKKILLKKNSYSSAGAGIDKIMTCDAENGTYEIFQTDVITGKNELGRFITDTMFSVRKK